MEKPKRKLILESGEVFIGDGFGAAEDAIGEIVFNTSMAGYQEIISDPGYADQIIAMSYPLIGNYGVTDEDYESKNLMLKALIVREYNDNPSNFRYTKTLSELLEETGVPALSGIDTRKLVRIIRDKGSMAAMLTDECFPDADALKLLRKYKTPLDAAKRAGCKKRWYSRTPNHRYNIVAVDMGIKFQLIKQLNALGCNVTMVPFNITAEEVLNLRPDGLLLSNGPGNPENLPEVIELVKALKGKLPIMGVSLGHELIALAYGAKVDKLKFGHRGANHPVRDEQTGRIEVFVQNHGYAVDESSLENTALTITHTNVLDKTVEGVEDRDNYVFSVQFHPESAQGPSGEIRSFEKFISNIEEWKKNAEEN